MPPLRRIGPIALSLAVVAALAGHATGLVEPLWVDLVLGPFFAWTSYRGSVRLGARPLLAGTIVLALLAAALVGVLFYPDLVRLTPYVAFLPANLAAGWLFAQGLRPGHTPILLKLIRLMGIGPEATPEFARFVRGQCKIWVALSLLTSLAAVVCMLTPAGPAQAMLTGLLAVQVGWFILSHLYARWAYGRPESWIDTVVAMARPATWQKLGVVA